MTIETRIMKNLSDRVNPVNTMIALSGIDDLVEGDRAIHKMIGKGLVDVRRFTPPGMRHGLPLYKLTLTGHSAARGPHLVVDNPAEGS